MARIYTSFHSQRNRSCTLLRCIHVSWIYNLQCSAVQKCSNQCSICTLVYTMPRLCLLYRMFIFQTSAPLLFHVKHLHTPVLCTYVLYISNLTLDQQSILTFTFTKSTKELDWIHSHVYQSRLLLKWTLIQPRIISPPGLISCMYIVYEYWHETTE